MAGRAGRSEIFLRPGWSSAPRISAGVSSPPDFSTRFFNNAFNKLNV